MADFDTAEFRANRFSRNRADELADRAFPVVMRGYDRAAVDAFVQEVAKIVGDLESRQSQETVVQRAIEEVGEETASILQRAEREAELLRQEADAYTEKIVVDTRLLWEERQQLLDDLRQLADDVLSTADDAQERVAMPEPLSRQDTDAGDAGDAASTDEHDIPTTNEVELDLLPGGAAEEADEGDLTR